MKKLVKKSEKIKKSSSSFLFKLSVILLGISSVGVIISSQYVPDPPKIIVFLGGIGDVALLLGFWIFLTDFILGLTRKSKKQTIGATVVIVLWIVVLFVLSRLFTSLRCSFCSSPYSPYIR